MAKIVVVWPEMADPDAFDADYLGHHAKLAATLPGIDFSTGRVVDGSAHRVSILSFESEDALKSALSTELGADLKNDARRLREKFDRTPMTLMVRDED